VRCIEDRYQPLSSLRPEGYSLPLLHAIDQALQMEPRQRPQSVDELAALIDLPVSEMEALVATVLVPQEEPLQLPDPEPVVLAVNPAAGAAEPVMPPRVAKRLSRPLLLLSGLAVIAVAALVWGLNHDDSVLPEHSAAASNSTPAATPSPAAIPASAPAMATVYLKLSSDEALLLNGSVMEVMPNTSGYASLNLAAGDYHLEVRSASGVRSQQLKIDRAGTWLINPGR